MVVIHTRKFNPERQAALRARAAQKFIGSLLEGSPVQRQVITLTSTSDTEKRTNAAPVPPQQMAAVHKPLASTKPKKADLIRQKANSDRRLKQERVHQEQLESLERRVRSMQPEERVDELTRFASACHHESIALSTEVSVRAISDLVHLIKKKPHVPTELETQGDRKQVFERIQRVLRDSCAESLTEKQTTQLAACAQSVGFEDLSHAIKNFQTDVSKVHVYRMYDPFSTKKSMPSLCKSLFSFLKHAADMHREKPKRRSRRAELVRYECRLRNLLYSSSCCTVRSTLRDLSVGRTHDCQLSSLMHGRFVIGMLGICVKTVSPLPACSLSTAWPAP